MFHLNVENETSATSEKTDTTLMPPPSWVPNHSHSSELSTATVTTVSPSTSITPPATSSSVSLSPCLEVKMEEDVGPMENGSSLSQPEEMSSTKEKSKLNTPLAAMLPPELADRDVREWFPEFRPGQVSLPSGF